MTRSDGAWLLRAFRFDLDVDRNRLANAGDGLGGWRKHQIEVAPRDWVGRHRPTRPTRVTDRRQQFHMKGDRLRDAVHCEIAKDVATLRLGSFHAAALECHLRIFLDVEELCAAQMIVSLFDLRVDAAHVYLSRNRGVLRMLTIDFDFSTELREFSIGAAEKLMHRETNGRTGRIELVGLVCRGSGSEARDDNSSEHIW